MNLRLLFFIFFAAAVATLALSNETVAKQVVYQIPTTHSPPFGNVVYPSAQYQPQLQQPQIQQYGEVHFPNQYGNGWSPYSGQLVSPKYSGLPFSNIAQPNIAQPNIDLQSIDQQSGFVQPNATLPYLASPLIAKPNEQPLGKAKTGQPKSSGGPNSIGKNTNRQNAANISSSSSNVKSPRSLAGDIQPIEDPQIAEPGGETSNASQASPLLKSTLNQITDFATIEDSRTHDRQTVKMSPTSLADLIAIDKQVEKTLPKILPAVVAIEGGSGVIVSQTGFILTASHVTKKANRIVDVRLPDGRTVRAMTLGTNGNTDTAALKILQPGPWPFIKTGDSSLVSTGDWCLALGYPVSFKRGESAAVRVGRVLETSDHQIVTDCAITGGDSGGPLVNLNGTLIGVSSRIRSDINQNIHIPVQNFQDDWNKLATSVDIPRTIERGKPRAYLGILGETDVGRVRIRSVIKGSPAAVAGMLKEDVILQMDGKPIDKFDDVLDVLTTRKPGEKVVAKLNRYGSLMSVDVRLGSQGEK
ncbi:MAG: S1C family serine protease [Mariniblastus sp.]